MRYAQPHNTDNIFVFYVLFSILLDRLLVCLCVSIGVICTYDDAGEQRDHHVFDANKYM